MKDVNRGFEVDEALMKQEIAKRYEPRSRIGNAVPPSKSKLINRKKAKAARAARKRK